ncbi:MAG TPA: trypsin inhibitor-like cysteine-rich domain-containing protein [bacterium]|nr:trypsin inhibitor-like cysteine-rich domain-containing protein [bacterium]
MMKRSLIFVFFIFMCSALSAQYTGQTMGPNVSELNGKKLQWDAGSYDYFIMFKSLMTNNIRVQCDTNPNPSVGCDLPSNPESDTCLTESTFTLTSKHVPDDSYIEAAYLVWTTSIDPSFPTAPTDNTAQIEFASSDGKIFDSATVTAPRQGVAGTVANNGNPDFSFEGITIEDAGTVYGGYYTYRVDVTDFFAGIHEKGRVEGYGSDGMALYGDYTVSDVACTNNSAYISQINGGSIYSSTVACGWSLILVYRSYRVSPKMVYIYNGFSQYVGQNIDLTVSGFEFPDKPLVKMSFAVNEGDPGFAYASGCGGGFSPCPPEGLQVTGVTTPPESTVILQNECNPAKFTDSNGTAFNYSETYNSISSIYGWEDVSPTCAGGDPNNPDPDKLEYTMDVDTFLMDSETNNLFNDQFKKGDTMMFFKIGANRDVVYTNYMVLSVDTKAPRYDIPPNADTPSGREKNYCSCSEKADSVCFTAPFYFAVKVQNWGDDISTDVTIQDKLSSKVTYVPGTTEICKEWKEPNVCSKWIKIEDKDGNFPLSEPYTLTDVLMYCDPVTMECPETIMVRFKVLPKDNLQKHDVIENTALINDSTGKVYKTNTSIPLRLVSGTCPSAAECENPDLTECGGVPGEGCEKDEECPDGQVCDDNGKCVVDTSKFTKDAKITVAIGKNSPINSSPVIIPADSKGLVMGQISIIAGSDSTDKFFNFNSMTVKVNKDASTIMKNIKLIYDANGNGKADKDETTIAEPSGVDDITISFANKSGNTVYSANVLHHFIMIIDASYQTPDDIPMNTVFNFEVDAVEAFDFTDAGNPVVEVQIPMEFIEYSFEPTEEVFVFTKGDIDPPVPSIANMNKTVEIMQIRTKALKHSNTLEKIKLKTAAKSVLFGEGIESIKIFNDADKDGSFAAEELLATASISSPVSLVDVNFLPPLNYSENEEKTLLVVATFNIPKDKMAQVEILDKTSLAENVDIIGLPLKSKEFWYKCEEGDTSCQGEVDEKDGGCTVSAIDESSVNSILMAVLAVFGLLLFGRKYGLKSK